MKIYNTFWFTCSTCHRTVHHSTMDAAKIAAETHKKRCSVLGSAGQTYTYKPPEPPEWEKTGVTV